MKLKAQNLTYSLSNIGDRVPFIYNLLKFFFFKFRRIFHSFNGFLSSSVLTLLNVYRIGGMPNRVLYERALNLACLRF